MNGEKILNMVTINKKDRYYDLVNKVAEVGSNLIKRKSSIFRTRVDANTLWTTYLSNLPEDIRGQYNCHSCKKFIEKYGGLVYVDPEDNYKTHSVFWGDPELLDISEEFKTTILAMKEYVESSHIDSRFYTTFRTIGVPENYSIDDEGNKTIYRHFNAFVNSYSVLAKSSSECNDYIAQSQLNYKLVMKALDRYNPGIIDKAIMIINMQFPNETRYIKRLEVLIDAYKFREKDKLAFSNYIWYITANAPKFTDFNYINGSIGILLDGILFGKDNAIEEFGKAINPINYMRAKAAPTLGSIDQANKLIKELGMEHALVRRYASFDEIPDEAFVWKPTPQKEKQSENNSDGFFNILKEDAPDNKSENNKNTVLDSAEISLESFISRVLPVTESIGLIPRTYDNWAFLLTAQYHDEPSYLKRDKIARENGKTNPFSSFVYEGGTRMRDIVITQYSDCECIGVIKTPSWWYSDESITRHDGYIFLVEGARDLRHDSHGSAIFAEDAIDELYPIRQVLEAFSNKTQLNGFEEASGYAGLQINKYAGSITAICKMKGNITKKYFIKSI